MTRMSEGQKYWVVSIVGFAVLIVGTWSVNRAIEMVVESWPHGTEPHVQVALALLYPVNGWIFGTWFGNAWTAWQIRCGRRRQ